MAKAAHLGEPREEILTEVLDLQGKAPLGRRGSASASNAEK